jgi:hypothetical protein
MDDIKQDIEIPSAAPKAKKADEAKEEKVAKGSILDQLREEITREVTRPDIEVPVPERDGVSVRFSPNISNEQLKSWRRNSTNRKTDELDSIKFSCYVIGQTVTGIYFNDELVEDDAGYALNFASPAIMEMTNTTKPLPDAIRAFYAVDPHLESTALKILDYAGYGDEVDAEDPTKG